MDAVDKIRRQLLGTPEPAQLGPQPRPGVLPEGDIRDRLQRLASEIPSGQQEAVLSLALLWHDHLDASHSLSQNIHSADGSFIHAIMHRREPDYWNSKYWWRQTGAHPAFEPLGQRVTDYLGGRKIAAVQSDLVRGGRWVPDAFVDACEAVAGRAADERDVKCLRELQRIEFGVLLEWLVQG
jgi:hypothetical protein